MTEEVEEHILKRFELIKKIGSGAYGHVWKVRDRRSGQLLALKKIFDAFQHSTDAQRTYREISFLRQFHHDNIIKLVQVHRAQNDKDIYLLFEYMQADLHNVIRQKILQDVHKQYIVYQVVLALKYLHSGEVIHRDLKPSNVLLNSECFVKLCDFGLVRSLAKHDEHAPVLTEYVATRWYRAPQILLGANDYTKGVDLWSLGCMIGEIILGKPMFPGNSQNYSGTSPLHQLELVLTFTGKPSLEDIDSLRSDLARSMVDALPPIDYRSPKEWFPYCDDNMLNLIVGLLQFNPNRRLTVEQVLRHPYVKTFAGKGSDMNAGRIFRVKNDDQKLTPKQYKALIYESIRQDRRELTARNEQKAQMNPSSTVGRYLREKDKQMPTVASHQSKLPKQQEQYKPYTASTIEPMSYNPRLDEAKGSKKMISITTKKPSIFIRNEQPNIEKSTIAKPMQANISSTFYSPKATYDKFQGINTVKPNTPNIKYIYGSNNTFEPRQELKQEHRPDAGYYFQSIRKKP